MPRELVHWKVVEISILDFQRQGLKACTEIASKYGSYLYLGSLLHDAPYYYKLGHSEFSQVSEYLHGRDGEDTLEPLKHLATAILKQPADKREPLWALLLGMLSHVATDIHFHPLVYYFTGNYYHSLPRERSKAQARHRLFEVYLESWIRPQCQTLPHGRRIEELIKNCPQLKSGMKLLDSLFVPEQIWPERFSAPKLSGSRWYNAIDQMAWAQGLFLSPWVGALLRCLNLIFAHRLDPWDHLAEWGRRGVLEMFKSPMEYQNPVSGQKEKTSCEELLQRASEEMLGYARLVEKLLEGASPEEVFKGQKGLSLNYGLYKVRSDAARYFAGKFPLNL